MVLSLRASRRGEAWFPPSAERRMHRRMVLLLLVLSACSSHTPAGPIGAPMDLRPYLPDSLRSAAPSAGDSTFRQVIRVGPDSAQVEVTWAAFHAGAGRYLSSFSGRLLSPAPY